MVERLISVTTMAGDDVRSPDGQELGSIKEIFIDPETGHVAYIVLAVGGFFGMGRKLFAVPWSAITIDRIDQHCILDIDPETLRDAEGFDPDHWPDFSDRTFGERVHRHYGVRPYWTCNRPHQIPQQVRGGRP